jgi:Cu(I)/Ag(I) efflux system membrane fusion protein
LLLILAGLSLAGENLPAGEKPGSLWQPYLSAQSALAEDNYRAARGAVQLLAQRSDGELRELADKAAAATNIEDLRHAFKPLSEKMSELKRPEDINLVFCPMADGNKGAHWLQKGDKVMNPYFGASMLHCGVIKE